MEWTQDTVFAKFSDNMNNVSFAKFVWNALMNDEHSKSIMFNLVRNQTIHSWAWIANNLQALEGIKFQRCVADTNYVLDWNLVYNAVDAGKQHSIKSSHVCKYSIVN